MKSNVRIFKQILLLWWINCLSGTTVYMLPPNLWIYIGKCGFPGSSVGKESTCNEGDWSPISGSGNSPGEGIGCPFQYSWAPCGSDSKESTYNLGDLGSIPSWEDPLEKKTATHYTVLGWGIPRTENAWQALVLPGVAKVGQDWATVTSLHIGKWI